MELNKLRDEAYSTAKDHGWHDKNYTDSHFLMLIVTEIAEAVQADRTGRHSDIENFKEFTEAHDSTAFTYAFDDFIKGSVEDELADVAIRCLDLAGLRNINLDGLVCLQYIVGKNKTFTENCYAVVKGIVNYRYTLGECLNYAIRQIFRIAEIYGIDLEWHIRQKMKYNTMRPYRHGGKRY